jgi:murein DD-endopeptidase MepM/ murein hydrolase activator NlpD
MRRLYNRLFSPARRDRKRAILKDFEEELIDRTHRTFVHQMRRRIMLRSTAVFLFIFMIGTVSPNFFSLSDSSFEYQEVSASFEEDYAQSILLSVDGFLTKTYAPTEESKGANGVFSIEVAAGDTLSGLAERYGVTVRDIIINNNLPQNPLLKPGQKLMIANGIIHQVGSKETADSIAKAYGVEKEKILAANSILEKEIKAGMKLVITGAKKTLPTFATPSRSYLTTEGAGDFAYQEVPLDSKGKLLFPTVGKYTQFFRAGHYAVDIANNQSPGIAAAEAGVVEKAQCGWNGGYGCHVIIDHGDGFKTLYAHMRKIHVTVGEQVARGQDLGQMGNTGRVYGKTGIHLHFEVTVNGVKRNPLAFF